ncbi:MAG: amidohydrolase family protein [Ignavibacteriae bacterium]|nr:amidohydrolase family protein [Ignavibacteriota bacterium]
MKIIDGHIHIGKWSSIFFNYETTVEQAIEVMKTSGIDSAVCLPADATSNSELFNDINNQKDFKFYFAAWINPDDRDLDKYLEKNINGVSIFKFHPSIQRRKITDDTYKKYIELALENNKPIVVHCGRWKEVASYEYPLELSKKYPKLKIILAHLGGDQPGLYLDCAKEVKNLNSKNIYLGTESIREFYFVNQVVKTVGADKVIFGSDYNLGLPKMYIPIIESLDISDSEKELIFSGNLLRLLNN